MAMDNLEKLREKVGKDPASKLFVPLAEEYKKAGMLDKAIETLSAGLVLQPGYMSARVALGKIFLEKGMQEAARDEFEKVIKAIPDNLFAQRKLAEIYMGMGNTESALARYKTVLKLNPLDEEVSSAIKELEEFASEKLTAEKPLQAEPVELEEIIPEQPALEEAETLEILTEELPSEEPVEIPTEMPEFVMPDETTLAQQPYQEETEEIEIIKESSEALSIEEAEELLKEVSLPEEAISIPEELLAEAALPEETDEFMRLHEEPLEEVLPKEEAISETPMTVSHASLVLADSFISEGNYYEAMRTYKTLLKDDPQNKRVMQRTHELKALLKLLGKDKEVLVVRLETFLNAIKKRGSELFRSS
ncbi:MAG: tetratricopeptide repeat protein [Nitrospirae bacterium]|nr:tetratricopeptide repeat protein [Nitrospirota bacterium]